MLGEVGAAKSFRGIIVGFSCFWPELGLNSNIRFTEIIDIVVPEKKNHSKQWGDGSSKRSMVRLLQTYSKHCITSKTLRDVRLRAESEHRETEVGRRIPVSAAQMRPEQVDEIVRLYSEMKSVKGLARHLGIHHHTVRKHLVDRGVEIEQPRQMSDDELALATHLYIDEQLTAAQIAPKIGFTAGTIVKALNRPGVKMRPQVARG